MTVYRTSLPTHGVSSPSKVNRELNQVVKGNRKIDSLREAQQLLMGYDGSDRLKQIIDGILSLIPEAATLLNKLADKGWVNNKITEADADFKGTYASVAALEQVTANKNDYGWVYRTDSSGNYIYDKYKYTSSGWLFEYSFNQNSFTAAEWAAIQSTITLALVQRLQELDQLVGSAIPVEFERQADGTLVAAYRQIAQPEPEPEPEEEETVE